MRAIRVLAALALVLGSFGIATPVAAGDPCYHDFDIPPLTEGADPQVKLMPCALAPTVVRVAPGTTVEFYSGPYDVHLITGAGQEWGSRDDEIQPDSMVSFRFLRAGTYPYACALHRGMSGAIVVGNGIRAKASAGSGPAVVTVVGPTTSAAPSAVAAAPAAPAAAARVSAEAAAAGVAAVPPTAPAAAERSNLAPIAAIAVFIGIVVTMAAIRLAATRRSHRRAPLEG
jgi:plastocyanin